MTFPAKLTHYLVNVDTRSWRSIRAKVKWAYKNGTFAVPTRLIRFITFLPPDPDEWIAYANSVSQLRKQAQSAAEKKLMGEPLIRKRKHRREYQRDYMRDYRKGLRRHEL